MNETEADTEVNLLEFLVGVGFDEWIACALESPVQPTGIVVLCHGLTSDMTGPGGLQRQLSMGLSSEGLAVLRFDARGSADSSVSHGQPTVSTMVEDALSALKAPSVDRFGPLPLIFCGISLGALASAEAARQTERTAGVIAISSDLADGDLRPWPLHWSRADEHEIPAEFMTDLKYHRPRRCLLTRGIPLSVIIGERDKGAASASSLSTEGANVQIIPNGDHLFQSKASRADLIVSVRRQARAMIAHAHH